MTTPSAQAALQALTELERAKFDCKIGNFGPELAKLRQFIEGAERDRVDAERYRSLRAGKARTTGQPRAGRIEVCQWESRGEGEILKGHALDAAVDAFIAARSAEHKGKT